MCEWCFKHGAGGKWYLNAKNYSDEMAKELDLEAYLTEQWRNFENVFIRKIMGFSSVGLGYKLQIPIIGRAFRYAAEGMIHSESKNRHAFRADGHFGQVVPAEDAKIILSELAPDDSIIQNYCMCRMMQKGIKDACCINFGVLSGVIEKLPRFIPENTKYRLDHEEAVEQVEIQTEKGRIPTVWFQPVPYINAVCFCESPQCGGLRLRTDFGLNALYKGEYLIEIDPDNCTGCKECIAYCQFGALTFSPTLNRVLVDHEKCFGCGLCRQGCNSDALELKPREEFSLHRNSF